MHALLLGVLLAIDPSKSTAAFSVKHVFVEQVTGTVAIVSGTIEIPDGRSVPDRIEATLDPKSFKTDEPDRDAALKGADWFDVAQFPTWTFTSTKITSTSKGFTLEGLLTIHGVSQLEAIEVTTSGTTDRPIYRGTTQIDRHAFGMTKTRLDPVIGGSIAVNLLIVTR